jgi:hypothetical protein
MIDERATRFHDSTLVDRCSIYEMADSSADLVEDSLRGHARLTVGPMGRRCGPMRPQIGAPRRVVVDSVLADGKTRVVFVTVISGQSSYTVRYRFAPLLNGNGGGLLEVSMGNFYDPMRESIAPYKPPGPPQSD